MSVWMVLSTRLAKPTADASEGGASEDDEPVVCCIVFLLADVVLKLQVCDVLMVVAQQ